MHSDPSDMILTLRMRPGYDPDPPEKASGYDFDFRDDLGTTFDQSTLDPSTLDSSTLDSSRTSTEAPFFMAWTRPGCGSFTLSFQDVHEGTAFQDSLPSTKALPLWSDLDMLPTKASPLRMFTSCCCYLMLHLHCCGCCCFCCWALLSVP